MQLNMNSLQPGEHQTHESLKFIAKQSNSKASEEKNNRKTGLTKHESLVLDVLTDLLWYSYSSE